MSDLARGLDALAKSREAYETAESYYLGTVEEYFASSAIRKRLVDNDPPFRLNFAAKPVDARINIIGTPNLVVPKGNDVLNVALREKFIGDNDLDEDFRDFFRKAAYFGDYYFTVWEAETEDDEPDAVEVYGNSPLVMRMIYSRENQRKALFAIKVWESDESTTDAPLFRVNLYYKDRIEPYISKKGSKGQSADQFEPFDDTDENEDFDPSDPATWWIENPYNRLPVFHLRQGSKPYGTPVHVGAFGPQDSITKLSTTHMATIDFQGTPQRYALVDPTFEGDAGDDDFVEFDTSPVSTDPQVAAEGIKKKGKLKSGPGELWWLEGVKTVGQFEPASEDVFLKPEEFTVKAMAVLTGTPLYEFDLDGEQPSGESRRLANLPLTNSVTTMRRAYAQPLERGASLALAILGYGDDIRVECKWPPMETASAKDDWETIALKIANGVPLRAALIEAGYTPEQVEEWYPKDTPALAIASLTTISAALASFGNAVTLGSMTAEDVKLALPALFAAVDRPEGK